MSELTNTGFTRDRLADIKESLTDRLIEEFGGGFVTTSDNPIMTVVDIIAERLSLNEEAIESVYNGQYPSTAGGVSLDNTVEINGITRLIAQATIAPAYLAGTPSTLIPAGSLVSVAQTGEQFALEASVTLDATAHGSVTSLVQAAGTATATIAGHTFLDGDYIFIIGADQSDYNGVHPISNVTGSTFDFSVSTGAVSPATGTITAKKGVLGSFKAVETGPIQALARSLNTIENPVSGWEHVENYVDATIGRNIETDAELRTRREISLAIAGGGTVEAILSRLRNVSGVSKATVFQNDTGVIDVSGRPPHSVEAFVTGGVDQDIAEALFASVSAGIETVGSEGPFTVVDSAGEDQTYKFSRLTDVLIHVYMKITKNADPNEGPLYPATGDTDIRTAIIDYGDTLQAGQDLKVTPYVMAAIGSVDGVDVTELYVVKSTGTLPGDPANPGDLLTTIPITATEIATFESLKIWINGATS